MHLLDCLLRQAEWIAKAYGEVAILPAASDAEQEKSHEAEFRAFYAEFLAAVRASDKQKLVDLIAFPLKDWSVEREGLLETIGIKDKSDFLAKYDSLFTPFVRSHILDVTPQKVSDDRYTVVWQDANAEFNFQFEYMPTRGYWVTAYSISPR